MSRRPSKNNKPRDRLWTIARCNTLLRSFTQALRDVAHENIEHQQALAKRRPMFEIWLSPSRKRQTPSPSSTSTAEGTSSIAEDPAWATKKCRRKPSLKRTYSSQSRHASSSGFGSSQEVSHRTAATSSLTTTFDPTPYTSKRRKATPDVTSVMRCLCQGGLQAVPPLPPWPGQALAINFTELLEQTNISADDEEEEHFRTGVSSLFTMCLRKIPSAIAREAILRKEEDPDDKSDVQAELLDELRDRSWAGYPNARLLAEVVRSIAVRQLQDAIADGRMDDRTLVLLRSACNSKKCPREHDMLSESWYKRQMAQGSRAHSTSEAFFMQTSSYILSTTVAPQMDDGTLMTDFHYRRLRWGFRTGAFPPSAWSNCFPGTPEFGTTMEMIQHMQLTLDGPNFFLDVLQYMIGTFGTDNLLPDRSRLIPHPASHHMLSLVLAQLTAVAISTGQSSAAYTIRSATGNIMEALSIQTCQAQMMVLAANLFLDAANIYSSKSFERHMTWFTEAIEVACDTDRKMVAEMMAGTARLLHTMSRRRGSPDHKSHKYFRRQGSAFLQTVLDSLLARSQPPPTRSDTWIPRAAMRRFILDTALAFARMIPSRPHIAYANSVERKVTGLKHGFEGLAVALTSPERTATLRWEESLCEWVAPTPAAQSTSTTLQQITKSMASPTTSITLDRMYVPDNAPDEPMSEDEEPLPSPTPARRTTLPTPAQPTMPRPSAKRTLPPTPAKRTMRSLALDGACDDFDDLPSFSSGTTSSSQASGRSGKIPRLSFDSCRPVPDRRPQKISRRRRFMPLLLNDDTERRFGPVQMNLDASDDELA